MFAGCTTTKSQHTSQSCSCFILSLAENAPRQAQGVHLKAVRVLYSRDAPRNSLGAYLKGSRDARDALGAHLKVIRVLWFAGCFAKRSKRTSQRLFVFYLWRMRHEKLTAYISKLFVFYLIFVGCGALGPHLKLVRVPWLAGCATKSSTRTSQGLFVFYLWQMHHEKLAQSVHLKDCSCFIFGGCITKSSQRTSQSHSCSFFAGCATKRSRRTSQSCSCSTVAECTTKCSKCASQRLFVFYLWQRHHEKLAASSQSCSCFIVSFADTAP